MTSPFDPIRQRAQEVAETELDVLRGLRTDDLLLGALRSAYLQGRIDRSDEILRVVHSAARNDAEIESAATAARSVA